MPFLGDIPVIGHLFKTNTDQHERVERLFLISPRLIPAQRPMSATAPLGPQRPGGAVAVPPMPRHPEPEWLRRGNTNPSPDAPADNLPAAGER